MIRLDYLLKTVPYLAFSLSFIPESISLMHNELWLLDENMTLLAAFMGFFLIYWTRVYPSGDISTSKWGVTSARLSDVYCTPGCFSFPTLCLTGFWNPLHPTGSFYSQGSYMNRLTCWKLSLHNLRAPTLKDYPDRHTMWCNYLSERFTLCFLKYKQVRSRSKASINSTPRISSLYEFSGD